MDRELHYNIYMAAIGMSNDYKQPIVQRFTTRLSEAGALQEMQQDRKPCYFDLLWQRR